MKASDDSPGRRVPHQTIARFTSKWIVSEPRDPAQTQYFQPLLGLTRQFSSAPRSGSCAETSCYPFLRSMILHPNWRTISLTLLMSTP